MRIAWEGRELYCHISTRLPELKLYSQRFIKNAPITAPMIDALPPTATHITIVIEYAIVICDGVILPLKLTNTAPAIPANTADTTYINVLNLLTL